MLEPLEFYDRILYILRNFVEYGNYNKDPKKAVNVIHKYFPGKTIDECTICFTNTLNAYTEAIPFVAANKEYYLELYTSRENKNPVKQSLNEAAFFKKHNDVPDGTLKDIVGWVFHWHHER